MDWTLSNADVQKELETQFERLSVDFAQPGFCDSPGFVRIERRQPRVLEMYARYVEARSYSAEYLADARKKVAAVCKALSEAIESDGKHGRCVHASGVVAKMLDRLGVWNYVGKSSLTINFPPAVKSAPLYFWPLDEGNFVAPHAIVVAPPFGVVDVTLRQQPYEREAQRASLPPVVLAEHFSLVDAAPEDLANGALQASLKLRRIPFKRFLAVNNPEMQEVMHALPTRAVRVGDLGLKYAIVAVGGLTEALDDMNHANTTFGGKVPAEILRRAVLPQLG